MKCDHEECENLLRRDKRYSEISLQASVCPENSSHCVEIEIQILSKLLKCCHKPEKMMTFLGGGAVDKCLLRHMIRRDGHLCLLAMATPLERSLLPPQYETRKCEKYETPGYVTTAFKI